MFHNYSLSHQLKSVLDQRNSKYPNNYKHHSYQKLVKEKKIEPNVKLQSNLEKNETSKVFNPPTPLPSVLSPFQQNSPYYRHICKLADVPIKKEISGQDKCRPGRPARLAMDKVKLHYVVHYMFRGTWDHIIPEEDQNDLGRIEYYVCNLCQRRHPAKCICPMSASNVL